MGDGLLGLHSLDCENDQPRGNPPVSLGKDHNPRGFSKCVLQRPGQVSVMRGSTGPTSTLSG
jgi:hypothetical protein